MSIKIWSFLGPILADSYTLKLESKGESICLLLLDKRVFKFSEHDSSRCAMVCSVVIAIVKHQI